MIRFSKILKLVRNGRDISQEDLAKALHVTKSYISYIENDKKTPGIKFLQSFAQFFDIPLPLLLWEGFQIKTNSNKADREIKKQIDDLMLNLRAYYLEQTYKNDNWKE